MTLSVKSTKLVPTVTKRATAFPLSHYLVLIAMIIRKAFLVGDSGHRAKQVRAKHSVRVNQLSGETKSLVYGAYHFL